MTTTGRASRRCWIAVAVLLALLGLQGTAGAQPPAGSLDDLRTSGRLRPGDTIYVTDAAGQTTKGRLADLTPSALTLDTGFLSDTRRALPAASIERIQRADSLLNGVLIGLGAGLGAAAILPAAMCDLPDSECSIRVFAFVGVPVAVGSVVATTLVDRAIRPTVFRRAGGTVRLQLAPHVSAAGAAVTLKLSF